MDTPDAPYTLALRYKETGSSAEVEARNRDAVVAALDSQVAGDWDAMAALCHPDIVFHEAGCLPYGGAHHGIAATRAAVAMLFESFDRMNVEVYDVLAKGDFVILYGHVSFGVRKNGRSGDFTVCEVYRFREGRIVEWRVHYFDAQMVAQALAAD